MTCKVSIVVPIYDVEKYLAKCLDSLIAQTLKDIEIILINDCSPDESETIILEYQKKDDRIVYLKQKKNQGQGYARNLAIKEAKGEYILFVDSDDYITLNGAEVLYKKAKELNLDILEANYNKVYPTYVKTQKNKLFEEVLTGNEFFEKISYTADVVWNKIWRTSFIKENHLFFVKEIYEDAIFLSEASLVAKRIYRIDFTLYHYMIRSNSTMTTCVTKKQVDAQMKLIIYFDKNYTENNELLGKNKRLKTLLYCLPSLAGCILKFKPESADEKTLKITAKNLLKKNHKKYRKDIFYCNKLGNKQKVLLYISPYLMHFVLTKIVKN